MSARLLGFAIRSNRVNELRTAATPMSSKSAIEWTDATWNPTRGCSIVSPGCVNCYAMKQAHRFSYLREAKGHLLPVKGAYHGLTKQTSAGPQWTGVVRLAPEHILMQPYRWRKPRRIFVNSMSDLFHESLTNEEIAQVFHVMYGEASANPVAKHTYQILTKRPERMREWFRWLEAYDGNDATIEALSAFLRLNGPHPRVWLGVSVEDQQRADERIPILLDIPAAVRFISAEPLLQAVDLRMAGSLLPNSAPHELRSAIDWVIVGGESGPGARTFDVAWARSLVQQCKVAGVACFVKQLGTRFAMDRATWHTAKRHDRKGGDPSEWPSDLRVRQFPS